MTLRKRQESARAFDTVRRTTCCHCPAGCGIKVFLHRGRIVDLFGDEEHPANKGSLCPRGLLAHRHLGNPRRLVRPRIRSRLDRPFRVVSWEEALAFSIARLHEVRQRLGEASLHVHGEETSPFGHLLGGAWFCRHWGTPNGPWRFFPAPFGEAGALARMFGVPGSRLAMNSSRDWCNSRCILIVGCDLAASDPITFGPLVDARDRGATLLVVDSRATLTATRASFSLRIRPGSHAAVLKGIARLLIENHWLEEDFLEESTEGLPHLRAEVAPYTPRRVAEECWVDAGDLLRAARAIGCTHPLQVIAGDWYTRRQLSDEDLYLCAALVCLRGSIGVPGGGLNLLDVSPLQWPDGDTDPGSALPAEPRGSGLEGALSDASVPVGALVWYGNPCARLAGGEPMRGALARVPLVVHLSSYPDESFHHSHVSLPMASWLEYSGLVAYSNGRALQWHHGVVDPPGECRSPLEVWTDLARGCGLAGGFPWQAGRAADPGELANRILEQDPLTRALRVEALDPERNPPGGVLWPCVAAPDLEFESSRFVKGDVRGRNILFQRRRSDLACGRRFATRSGKISFVEPGVDPGPRGEDPGDSRFPLMLITGVRVDRIEEFGHFLSDPPVDSEPPLVQMHPEVALRVGVGRGDMVIVENDRARMMGSVWVDEAVDPRVIWSAPGGACSLSGAAGDSPRSLFAPPAAGRASEPFTRVIVYRPGQDKEEVRQRLLAR